jgi:hypothetical protein
MVTTLALTRARLEPTAMGVESLTYIDLADRLGTTPEAARSLVRRLRLPRYAGNDGKVRVNVDLTDIQYKHSIQAAAGPVAGRSPGRYRRPECSHPDVAGRACTARGREQLHPSHRGRSPVGLRTRARSLRHYHVRGTSVDEGRHGSPRKRRAARGSASVAAAAAFVVEAAGWLINRIRPSGRRTAMAAPRGFRA